MKTKIIIILSVIALLLSGGLILSIRTARSYKERSETNYQNSLNANFRIKELKAKNGDLFFELNQLTIKRNELEEVNKALFDEVKNLKSKLKNVNSVTFLNPSYIIRIDSIPIRDTVYIEKFKYVYYKDDYIDFYAEVTPTHLDNVCIDVVDSIYIVNETVYKGWWFWRKPKYSKIKIKSENPYFNLNKVETIKFD
jgi:hypothetical protein